MIIQVSADEAQNLKSELYYFSVGRAGSFTTHLFNAMISADFINFPKLAEAFPEHGYVIAESYRPEYISNFKLY